MPRLVILCPGDSVSEYELGKNITTIGRRPENDISIANPTVSGRHARLRQLVNDYILEDMNSTNGTWLNGKPVSKHALANGDTIRIGDCEIAFFCEEQGEQRAHENTAKVSSQAALQQEVRAPDAGMMFSEAVTDKPLSKDGLQTPAKPVSDSAGLKVLKGANTGSVIYLKRAITTVGVPGIQVAVVTRRPSGYFISNVEGGRDAAHPRLNGEIIGSKSCLLNDNDIIEVAGMRLQFNAVV